jgi:hypothetical protein
MQGAFKRHFLTLSIGQLCYNNRSVPFIMMTKQAAISTLLGRQVSLL